MDARLWTERRWFETIFPSKTEGPVDVPVMPQ